MNIIIFGPPGAGKGTQSKMICEKENLLHISTGDILRNEINSDSELGNNIKSLIDQGDLVSDEITLDVIRTFIKKNEGDHSGFLFDGFPRTIQQADLLSDLFKNMNIDLSAAVLIDVEQSVLINRIINRKEVEGRDDDNEVILASRLKIYYDQTAPLIDYYKNLKLLKWVDGVGEINVVNQRINSILKVL
jgi:adenylate kinase